MLIVYIHYLTKSKMVLDLTILGAGRQLPKFLFFKFLSKQ